jgi:dihydroorotase
MAAHRLSAAGTLAGALAAGARAPAAAAARRAPRAAAMAASGGAAAVDELVIARPDDWHLHLRDGDAMRSAAPHSAAHFARAVVMPNLVPPVTTPAAAAAYRARIADALGPASAFTPLMTLYLTDNTTAADVRAAAAAGVVAFKLYPAGATTNSDSGVTEWTRVLPALREMAAARLPLLVHGEVTDAGVDFFDREAAFIETRLKPLLAAVPDLRLVMEHITTREAAEFVAAAPESVAATITPQHVLWNRNALFAGGLRPHAFCLPVLKREEHRRAVLAAATSGSPKFFLGTDSAPHARGAKEAACGCAGVFSAPVALALYAHAFESVGALHRLEGFASHHGADFYGLPRNTGAVRLVRRPWRVPEAYTFGGAEVVPMWAGLECPWAVEDVAE